MLIATVHSGQEKVLFLEIRRVKNFLSLTRPHSRMCMRIYIFNFKKQTKKKKEKEKKKEYKKATETIEEKIIFPENRLKRSKFADAQVKIFLVARLSRNKSNFFWSQEKERPYEIFLVLKTLKKLGWNQSKCFLNKSL